MSLPEEFLPYVHNLDEHTRGIYLEIPAAKVVFFQAVFEAYEGLGTVRTIDIGKSLVCLVTTDTMLSDCFAALAALKAQVPWRFSSETHDLDYLLSQVE